MTSIKSYSTFIRDSLDFNNFITKFSVMLNQSVSDVEDNFSSLYSLYLFIFVL